MVSRPRPERDHFQVSINSTVQIDYWMRILGSESRTRRTISRQNGERDRGAPLLFYRVCCTPEAFNPAARCTHANYRVLPFINKTEPSFLSCLASQKNPAKQIGRPMSRFFAFRGSQFSSGIARLLENRGTLWGLSHNTGWYGTKL